MANLTRPHHDDLNDIMMDDGRDLQITRGTRPKKRNHVGNAKRKTRRRGTYFGVSEFCTQVTAKFR